MIRSSLFSIALSPLCPIGARMLIVLFTSPVWFDQCRTLPTPLLPAGNGGALADSVLSVSPVDSHIT
jgi:hypothetical protein